MRSIVNILCIILLIACDHKSKNKPHTPNPELTNYEDSTNKSDQTINFTNHYINPEQANCEDSKKLASQGFNSQIYYSILPKDAQISFTEDPPLEIYTEALENITQFEYVSKIKSANEFNFECFNNTQDSLMRLEFGKDWRERIQLKADSMHIDELASSVKSGGVYTKVHKMPKYAEMSIYEFGNIISVKSKEKAEFKGMGRSFYEIIIDEDGNLESCILLKGIENSLDDITQELLMKSKTNWTAGELHGNKVRVKVMLPIKYR